MFFCHAVEIIKSIRSGKVAVMTKLYRFCKTVFATAVNVVCESVWAVGAEVAAA
jgi:hypothetical protein